MNTESEKEVYFSDEDVAYDSDTGGILYSDIKTECVPIGALKGRTYASAIKTARGRSNLRSLMVFMYVFLVVYLARPEYLLLFPSFMAYIRSYLQ